MSKKLISIGLLASSLIGLAAYAAQDTAIERVEVRDPVRLEAFLEANAADAESRLDVLEAVTVGGALDAGKIIVGNVTNVAEAQTMSGAATINSNGVVTLAGNIPVARITNAVPALAYGNYYVVNTTQLVFIITSGAVTNLIDADITH